jgi:hypothetical protein
MNSRSLSFVLLAVSLLVFTGCAGTAAALSSPLAQGAFNTAAETAAAQILTKDPTQMAPLQALALALPTALKGSLTSENIGVMVKTIATPVGGSSDTTVVVAAALDGAVRNYVKQNGGDVPTLQGAIAQQILTNFADGLKHGISLYQSTK